MPRDMNAVKAIVDEFNITDPLLVIKITAALSKAYEAGKQDVLLTAQAHLDIANQEILSLQDAVTYLKGELFKVRDYH